MAASAKAVHYRRDASDQRYAQTTCALLAIAGSLLSLAGAVLAIGGYLSPLGGSAFYMLVGVALTISGMLIARRHRVGAWTYMVVFAGTVSWSLQNLGSGSSLLFRLVGPAALLAVLALLMPVLCNWRPRQSVIAFALIIAATVGLGVASSTGGPLAAPTAAVLRVLDAEARGLVR